MNQRRQARTEDDPSDPTRSLTSAKTVIRCRDISSSRHFYSSVLGLAVVDEWDEPGGKGCIFAVGPDERGAYIEVYEMTRDNARYHASYALLLETDKIDLQLRTEALDSWVETLCGIWPFSGPEQLPWGQRWIRLRDPDNLLIAIYEGSV